MSRPINKLRAVHPGEILREEFLRPLQLSITGLARALDVPPARLHAIVHETRSVTADTAVRLERHFGGDAASWLALQAEYDLKTLRTRREIESRVQPRQAA
ncbi:MAG: HigA family addiction module antitoxin [Stenotrophomonas sp.]